MLREYNTILEGQEVPRARRRTSLQAREDLICVGEVAVVRKTEPVAVAAGQGSHVVMADDKADCRAGARITRWIHWQGRYKAHGEFV